jgi:hypothetical protein
MKMRGVAALGLCMVLAGCASTGRPPAGDGAAAVEHGYDDKVREAVAYLKYPAAAIEDNFGKPWRMVNVGGIGFYGYEDYGFYFDNIVFYYENGFKVPIDGNPARVLAIDCLDEDGLQGIVKGKSGVGDVVAAFGDPDEIRNVAGGDEIANPFAGRYYLYRVDEGCLAFRLEGDSVQSIMAIDGGAPLFR